MTTLNPLPQPSNWQKLYSASENRWKDVEKIGAFLLPIIALVAVSFMYVYVGYAQPYSESLVPQQWTWFSKVVYVLEFLLIILAPFLAVVLGLVYIFKQAALFIRYFYQPEEDEKIGPLIRRRLLGVIPVPPPLDTIFKYPSILIKGPSLPETHWARRLGGPANLIIYDGLAVYLERGNQFSRVVGPSTPPCFLEQHERIKEIVDLRPQIRTQTISPWTKDGIRIQLGVRGEYQINAIPEGFVDPPSNAKTTQSSTNPKFEFVFDPLPVKIAVEQMTVSVGTNGDLSEVHWLEAGWGTITGIINAYVTGHTLDELFFIPSTAANATALPENSSTRDIAIVSQKIREEIKNAQESLAQNGFRILDIQITDVKIPDKVQAFRKKYWESERARIAAVRNGRAEAEHIRIRQQAHAEAQRTMLNTITQKLERVDPDNLTEPLLLSLSGILDQSLDDPIVRPLIAKESFAVLERVRRLLNDRF